jgi:hypothetical protein
MVAVPVPGSRHGPLITWRDNCIFSRYQLAPSARDLGRLALVLTTDALFLDLVILPSAIPHSSRSILISSCSRQPLTMLANRVASAAVRGQCLRTVPRSAAAATVCLQVSLVVMKPTLLVADNIANAEPTILLRQGRQVHRNQGCQRMFPLSFQILTATAGDGASGPNPTENSSAGHHNDLRGGVHILSTHDDSSARERFL